MAPVVVNPFLGEHTSMFNPVKRTSLWLFFAVLFGLSSALSFAAPAKKTKPTPRTRIFPPPRIAGPGEKLKTYDLNKDKRPDLWKVFKNGKKVREEQDLNFDNRIDIRRFFKGKDKYKDIFDLDYDGKYDMINYYFKGRLYKQELFMKSKKRPDVFKYYEVVKLGKKKKKVMLVRKERDTNLDGKIDYWEYWEKGELIRILRDTNYDGKVNTQEKIGGN